jgi:hypothetical protein
MAALTVRLTDPDPTKAYFCPGCKHDVPLAGFRLLYRGTKRVLRCRSCEAAAAGPDMRRYYAREFERHQVYKRAYGRAHPEVNTAARARYNAAHAEEVREYKQGWYQVNRERAAARSKEHYRAHAAERNAQSAARYAARCRTPEAVASRQTRKEQHRADARAAWRRAVLAAVARNYGLTVDQVHQPGKDGYQLEARRMAVYCTHKLLRAGRRHPVAELAADYDLTVPATKALITKVDSLLHHRRTNDDGAWCYDVLQAVAEHVLKHRAARAGRRKAS